MLKPSKIHKLNTHTHTKIMKVHHHSKTYHQLPWHLSLLPMSAQSSKTTLAPQYWTVVLALQKNIIPKSVIRWVLLSESTAHAWSFLRSKSSDNIWWFWSENPDSLTCRADCFFLKKILCGAALLPLQMRFDWFCICRCKCARLSLHFICYPYFGPVLCFVYMSLVMAGSWLDVSRLVWAFKVLFVCFCFCFCFFLFSFFMPACFVYILFICVFF